MALDRARRGGAFTTHTEFSFGTPTPTLPRKRPQAGEGAHFRCRCSSIQSHPALGCPRILVPAAKLDSHLSLIALRTRNGLGKVPTAEVTVGAYAIKSLVPRDGTVRHSGS